MKRIYFLLCVILLLTVSCEKEHDDYFTQTTIEMHAPENVSLVQMQGSITLRNINSGQKYSSSSFQGSIANLRVLKGAYTLYAEGTCLYKLSDGSSRIASFRSSFDYIEIVNNPTFVKADMIILN